MKRDIQPSDDYGQKLSALLPAEVTGLYLFLRSLTNQNYDLYPWLGAFVLVIVVVLVVFGKQILQANKRSVVLLYCATFVLWAASMDVYIIADKTGYQPLTFIVPAAVAVWSFAVPRIFDAID